MPRLVEIIGKQSLYATRTFGFRPDTWGAMTFRHEGTVDRWVDAIENRAFVLCFTSHIVKDEVHKEVRGRVLGIYEIEPVKVHYKDDGVMTPDHFDNPDFLDEQGNFRWPWGLRSTRAWSFQRDTWTREALPDARRKGLEITTDLLLLSRGDFDLLAQYDLDEVQVYKRPPPAVLKSPNARPDYNYLFVCEDLRILQKMTGWLPGEILVKPGVSSDIEKRLDGLNDHPIAKLFGIKLENRLSVKQLSPAKAREKELTMIDHCRNIGQLAAVGQEEFFFVPQTTSFGDFAAIAGAVRKVD